MPAGSFTVVKQRIRLALQLIPKRGVYGDMRRVLNDILRMQTHDAKADLDRVIKALRGLPEWDWANNARTHLEYAVTYFNETYFNE